MVVTGAEAAAREREVCKALVVVLYRLAAVADGGGAAVIRLWRPAKVWCWQRSSGSAAAAPVVAATPPSCWLPCCKGKVTPARVGAVLGRLHGLPACLPATCTHSVSLGTGQAAVLLAVRSCATCRL